MSYANLLLNVLYHIVMEMKIRESCLQSGTFIYKPGISVTKQDFHLQMGSLGLQMGFSGYYLPEILKGLDIAEEDEISMCELFDQYTRRGISEKEAEEQMKLYW